MVDLWALGIARGNGTKSDFSALGKGRKSVRKNLFANLIRDTFSLHPHSATVLCIAKKCCCLGRNVSFELAT